MEGIEHIRAILNETYLERFKVFYPDTLFEPSWSNLKEGRCPLCSCKLKSPQHGKVFFCKSKKHPKPFIIKAQKFLDLTSS